MTPKFQFVANGLYEAPFGINVAANLLIRQGYGQPYYQEIEAPARDPYALKDVLLVPDVGDNRLQAIESFDLRVGKAFRVNGITMNVDLDWFNVLNAATVLGRQYDPGTADGPTGPGKTLEIMNPRLLRVGFRLRLSSSLDACVRGGPEAPGLRGTVQDGRGRGRAWVRELGARRRGQSCGGCE